ncbi:MAG: DoxX family protein [Verrucomicrobiota bacterium]
MDRRADYLTLLAWRLRVGLGLWFVWSGCQLVFVSGLTRFTQAIANYQMVAAPLDALVAYTLPWVEIVAGVFLMLGLLRRGTILALCGLVSAFAVAIGWAWVHNLNIACGCHGGDEPIQYWWKLLEFYAYYEALVFLWWMERRPRSDGP